MFYVNVEKNEDINKLVRKLEENLEEKINYLNEKTSSPEDKDKINLHFTIGNGIEEKYLEDINSFIKNQKFNPVEHPLFRVYLLKNKLILREYDFALKKSFPQLRAKMNFVFEETKKEFSRISGLNLSYDGMVLGKSL